MICFGFLDGFPPKSCTYIRNELFFLGHDFEVRLRLLNLAFKDLDANDGKSLVNVQPEIGGGAILIQPFRTSGLKSNPLVRDPRSKRLLPIIPIFHSFHTVRSFALEDRSDLDAEPSAVLYLSSSSILGILIFTGQAS